MGVNRRTFLGLAGAATSLLGFRHALAAKMQSSPRAGGRAVDVLVVGAGAFGSWTAWFLQGQGAQVELVDAFGPGNDRSSSGGETRLMREDYGENELYTRMAVRAFEHWRRYQVEWDASLFTDTGRLVMATEPYESNLAARKARLERYGVVTEVLNHDELQHRWPQIHLDDIVAGIYNPHAALLHARQACQIVTDRLVRAGGSFRVGRALPGRKAGGRLNTVRLSDGAHLSAGVVVFACGPWLARIFPELLGERLKVVRRDVMFFGPPAGDDRFSHPRLPTWGFAGPSSGPRFAAYYGFPDLHGRGFKVCPVDEDKPVEPDTADRVVPDVQIRRARAFLQQRFPGMAAQPVVGTRVCQTTNTASSDFIIDRHPDLSNVWIAGGGSGHGFKHGPAVGEYVANRILEDEKNSDYDAAFRLPEGKRGS